MFGLEKREKTVLMPSEISGAAKRVTHLNAAVASIAELRLRNAGKAWVEGSLGLLFDSRADSLSESPLGRVGAGGRITSARRAEGGGNGLRAVLKTWEKSL